MKKWFLLFIYSFGLNAVWENGHQFLYADYQGGPITEYILLRAAVVDAAIILLIISAFRLLPRRIIQPWLIALAGLAVAIGLEKWGISTGRWAYGPAMPIIPFLAVGITPAIQLGLTGCLAFYLAFRTPVDKAGKLC